MCSQISSLRYSRMHQILVCTTSLLPLNITTSTTQTMHSLLHKTQNYTPKKLKGYYYTQGLLQKGYYTRATTQRASKLLLHKNHRVDPLLGGQRGQAVHRVRTNEAVDEAGATFKLASSRSSVFLSKSWLRHFA